QAMENIKKGRIRPEEAAEATPEKLRARYAKLAEMRVKEEMILDAVARQENITVSEDEIDLRIKQMADQHHQRVDELKKQLIEHGSDGMLVAGMLEEKVFDFIIKNRQ
ncbi:MAG: hypothetical protein HZB81_02240, partial [Deltaproteobacteria bacterium]|nr:hypothetical protein [Deltaproteobacteria bacterium]